MKKILFFVTVFLPVLLRSQVITVIDRVSREALPGVLIFNSDRTKVTSSNAKGQADISALTGSDSLYFSYMGYRTLALTSQQVTVLKKVEMVPGDVALKEVVISANRWEEQASETSNRINKIPKREIELQNPQTSADLLETGGYVFVQKSQQAGGSPMLRGFATNRVLLVVDGVRMNNAIFRSGNLQNVISIDANAVQNAEVLFGPGAVMYGSDAIGGVMDFHTLAPQFSDSTNGLLTTGSLMGRVSSANREKTVHADVNLGAGKWSWLGSFSRSQYEDLRAGTVGDSYYLRHNYVQVADGKDSMVTNADPSLQKGSAFTQTNFLQKFGLKLGRLTNVDYALHYSESSNAPRYDRLYVDANNDKRLDYAEWYYGPQTWLMHRIGFDNTRTRGAYNKVSLIAAWQKFGESRHDRRFDSPLLRKQIEKVDALSLNLDLDKKLNERFSLFYGAEVIYNKVGSSAYLFDVRTNVRQATGTRYPDQSTWQAWGVYANAKYNLRSNLILSAGTRYSYFDIRARFDTTMFPLPFTSSVNRNGALNGAAGLSWLATVNTRLYLNLSSGFRAPNIDDIGKVFESQPGSVIVPNDRLGPEYAYNAEAGAVQVVAKRVKLDGAIYYTRLNNALARRPFLLNNRDSIVYEGVKSAVLANQNISTAFVYGLQAGIEAQLPHGVGFSSKVSYQRGREESDDSLKYYPKPHVAPFFGRTDLTYRRKRLRLDLYLVYNGEMKYADLSLIDRNDDTPFVKDEAGRPFVPAWYTVNFKMAWYFSQHASLSGGVENITDQLYRPFSSGISAAGRNFILSLRGKF